MFFIYQFVCTMYNSNVQLKGMEELKFYHSILSWYGLVTLFTLYLYGEKTKKKFNDTHRRQASRIWSILYTKFRSNFLCILSLLIFVRKCKPTEMQSKYYFFLLKHLKNMTKLMLLQNCSLKTQSETSLIILI